MLPAVSAALSSAGALSRLPFSFPSLAGRNPKPRTMPPARRAALALASASSSAAGSDDGSQPKPWLFVGLGNPGNNVINRNVGRWKGSEF
ncbi:hypothetical protein ACMD2_21273 [Ananas comosus]|uniref:Uncharacterized protein n=1 Tax=Ananas comosus TaxID=4615 RepID=A0A199VY74_ANACO|nr:hypothetical protein ACMD2_21273 [Ananas comosus]